MFLALIKNIARSLITRLRAVFCIQQALAYVNALSCFPKRDIVSFLPSCDAVRKLSVDARRLFRNEIEYLHRVFDIYCAVRVDI